MENNPRGRCFIINNHKFPDGIGNLEGYKTDCCKITKLFERLNFKVDQADNCTATEINTKVQEWCSMNFQGNECVILFLLSHGDHKGRLMDADGNYSIQIDEDVISTFHERPELKDLPKLFFIQACRGHKTPKAMQIEPAGAKITKQDKFTNTFRYYSTAEGFYSYVWNEGGRMGSVFLFNLCKSLEECVDAGSRSGDLWSLATLVNKRVSEDVYKDERVTVAQCPEVKSTLSSNFWFKGEENQATARESQNQMNLNTDPVISGPLVMLQNTTCKVHGSHLKRLCLTNQSDILDAFEDFNNDPDVYQDHSSTEVKRLFETNLMRRNFELNDCFVCIVLGCGGTEEDKPVLYCSDAKFYCLETLVSKVSSFKGLSGKPKIFFMLLNKCSNDNLTDQRITACAHSSKSHPKMRSQHADVFIYYVVLENEMLNRSRFIHELSNELKQSIGRNIHLGQIVFNVNEKLKKLKTSEIPEVCSTLTNLVTIGRKNGNKDAEEKKVEKPNSDVNEVSIKEEVEKSTTPTEEDVSGKVETKEQMVGTKQLVVEAVKNVVDKSSKTTQHMEGASAAEYVFLPIRGNISADTEQEMNLDGAEVVFALANKYKMGGLKRARVEEAKAGGGDTTASFLKFLITPDAKTTVKEVSEALGDLEMWEAKNKWDDITKGKVSTSALEVYEVTPMNKYLKHDPMLGMRKSWINLAPKLPNFPHEKIDSLKDTKANRGVYSPAEELLSHLKKEEVTMADLLQKLKEVQADRNLPSCMNVIDRVEGDIKVAMNRERKTDYTDLK